MQENEIPIHDLYAFVQPQQDKIMLPPMFISQKKGTTLAADVVTVIQKTLASN